MITYGYPSPKVYEIPEEFPEMKLPDESIIDFGAYYDELDEIRSLISKWGGSL